MIHFNSVGYCDKSSAKILCSTIEGFIGGKYGKSYYIKIKHEPKNKKHADSIVNEAIKVYMLRNRPVFNLVVKNCESFVEYCYELPYKNNDSLNIEEYGITQVDEAEMILIKLDNIFFDMKLFTHLYPLLNCVEREYLKTWRT